MQIERVEYREVNGDIVPRAKHVLIEVDDHHYIGKQLNYVGGGWKDSSKTSYFDGEKVHNGVLCTSILNTTKEKFALLIKHEGFKEVTPEKSELSVCGVDPSLIAEKKDAFVNDYLEAFPKADKDVLYFIADFLYHNNPTSEGVEFLRLQFRSGYCYHFAHMLKATFCRGEVVWCAPFGHFAWKDMDGVVYDIEGIYQGEAEYFIPESFVGDGIYDFLHVRGTEFNASKEYIDNIIKQYLEDFKK